MDREIDIHERRRRIRNRILGVVLLVVVVGVSVVLGADWLRPSVRRSQVRFGTVVRGDLEATVQASGTVVPAAEQVLSSPAEVRVERVLRRAGERVEPGEAILELDTTGLRSDLDSLTDKLSQNASQRTQQAVQHEDRVAALESRAEIQQLDLEITRYKYEQKLRLQNDGLVSEEELKQAQVEVRRAEIQLERIREEIVAAGRTHDADMRRLQLDADLLTKEKREVGRKLEAATTRSPVAGVLTWVADEVGSIVGAGQVVARIADLRSFRVEATISDAYADRLSVGQPVRIEFADESLDATLSTILPTIESGALTFEVDLVESDHPSLRHNLRVDALVVTGHKSDTLVAPRGPYIQRGGMTHQVFVVRGDRAVRTDIDLGLAGHKSYEVLSGLVEGDEIIISDMRASLHARELRIK